MTDPRDQPSSEQVDYLAILFPSVAALHQEGVNEFGDTFSFVTMTKSQASRLIAIRKAINEGRTPPGEPEANLTMEGLL